jgi:hypothetical protein
MPAVFLLASLCTYLCTICTGLCVCLVCINSPYSSHICECWPRDQSTPRPTTQNIHFSIHSQAPFYACLLVLSILIKQSQIGISDVFCLTLTAAKNDFFADVIWEKVNVQFRFLVCQTFPDPNHANDPDPGYKKKARFPRIQNSGTFSNFYIPFPSALKRHAKCLDFFLVYGFEGPCVSTGGVSRTKSLLSHNSAYQISHRVEICLADYRNSLYHVQQTVVSPLII